MFLKTFFRRISKDFNQRELLPIKMIFFVQASTLFVLYPYLTIHMRELGINVEETAIMSAVIPVVAIVMPPLAGIIADRIGNFKILLSIFSSLGGGAALLLLLVPIGRVTVEYPSRVVMDLSCSATSGEIIYEMSQAHPCESRLQPEVPTRIESCGYICNVGAYDHSDRDAMLNLREYSVNHYDWLTGENNSYKYFLSKKDMQQRVPSKEDMTENRKLRNNEMFKTSIRQLSESFYFFPTDRLYEFSCFESEMIEEFENSTSYAVLNETSDGLTCTSGDVMTPEESKLDRSINYYLYRSEMKALDESEEDKRENRRRYVVDRVAWVGSDLKRVRRKCILTAPRKDICSNMDTTIEYNIRFTFWLYLAIRVFIGMIGGTAFAMFEGAVIAILREHKADYGLQRIYGSIGGMISSPLSGLLIDYASKGKEYTDFRPAFYLYAALKVASGALMLTINLQFKAPASNVVSDVLSVLKNVEVVALLVACFVLGTAWGYIESFLFWLLQDLGGSRSLMGITITVGGIAGVPLLVMSGPIIDKIGHANVLFIGFIFYSVRLVGYSIIYNPWLSLIFEALESVTSSLSFTAAVTYAAKLSTTTTDSSIQGLIGGLYYGVGKGSGSLIGGYLMKAFGTRPTYQIFAVVCLVTGFLYYFFNVGYLRKRPQVEGNDIVKKVPKKVEKSENSLENGAVEMAVCQNRKIKYNGVENRAFVNDPNDRRRDPEGRSTKDMEAIKNARNLEEMDKSAGENDKSCKRSSELLQRETSDNPYAVSNPAFQDNETSTRCKVIVEKTPDAKRN
ncbi:uncharacterized protein [Prorops nasuta]|uniref:uncharacterized protein isoform X2 n=1 Tax=Prorops nasuta TaxID=863751 RepID=UPI0034CD867C